VPRKPSRLTNVEGVSCLLSLFCHLTGTKRVERRNIVRRDGIWCWIFECLTRDFRVNEEVLTCNWRWSEVFCVIFSVN
jgi:hypothetical protein